MNRVETFFSKTVILEKIYQDTFNVKVIHIISGMDQYLLEGRKWILEQFVLFVLILRNTLAQDLLRDDFILCFFCGKA